MKFLIVFIFFLSSSLFAGTGKVQILRGSATFGGQPLSSTSKIQGNGELVVNDKSFVKILFVESGTSIALGANSTSKINFAAPPELQELSLTKGLARWITGNKKGKGIRTSNAAMGVRGTDFYVSYNPLLGETEIICFDGEVQLTNAVDEKDSKIIAKNQWGGIGGRFGKKLSDVLTLSPELINSFKSALPLE